MWKCFACLVCLCNMCIPDTLRGHNPTWDFLVCHTHPSEVCLAGQGAWKCSQGKEFHGNSPPGALVFSLTHILIPYSRVSLVYGSTCSLLVLSYYKCLLRLNSDIAKPSPVFQCPRKSLSWPWAWNSVRMLPIQWHSELPLVLHYHFE